MNRAFLPSILSAAAALVLCAGSAHAVVNSTAASFNPIAPGDVVVYRIGDGVSTVLSNAAMPVFVDEFSPTGTLIQTIALPNTAGAGTLLTASGTATSEGLLTVSPDGRYITVTGYNAALGTTGVASTATSSVTRSVAVLDAFSGSTAYATTTNYSANNIRSAVSDGTNIWATGANDGVRTFTVGSSGAGVQVSSTVTNLRQANIFGGQLFVSTSSGSAVRLGAVGTGTPTTTGQTTVNLPGVSPSTGSPYSYFFADLSSSVAGLDTLYIADDGAAALTKYSLVAGSWVSNGVIGVAADAYRGITGLADASGSVQLYLTRKGGSAATGGGELLSLLDTSGYNGALAGSPTLLASAVTGVATNPNTAFRGVGVIVPAPGASALLGIGGLLLARRRR